MSFYKKNILNKNSVNLNKIKRIDMYMPIPLFKKAKSVQLKILQKEGKSVSFGYIIREALSEYLKKYNV